MVARATDLPIARRQEVIELCSRAFQEDLEPLFKTFPDPTHVLAFEHGALVSHALWITRWLIVDEQLRLRTAYVEAVATDPAHQRRGFATSVMRTLQAQIGSYQLGGLSPFEQGWYERLGWERWRGALLIRTQDGLLTTPEDLLMVLRLPATPAIDLEYSISAEWREGDLW